MEAATLLKEARLNAGLTQKQLATRLGISQAAVAQLEGSSANPTIATLERALRATNHELELRLRERKPSVDLTLLREALRMTPAERIATGDRLLRDAEHIAGAGARTRRKRLA